MTDREARIGQNEALFRNVNERLEDLNETFAPVTQVFDVVCECGNADCVEQITITPTEYERVRRDPHLFLVTPGHESPDVETIVEQGEYDVVRKNRGRPQRIAETTDPRS